MAALSSRHRSRRMPRRLRGYGTMTEKGRRRVAPVMTRLRPELNKSCNDWRGRPENLASYVEGVLEDHVATEGRERRMLDSSS